MPKKNKDDISSILSEINIALQRQNAYRYSFFHGIMRGVGTALGATVVVALVTSLTINFFDSPQMEALIQMIMNSVD